MHVIDSGGHHILTTENSVVDSVERDTLTFASDCRHGTELTVEFHYFRAGYLTVLIETEYLEFIADSRGFISMNGDCHHENRREMFSPFLYTL